ncbi:MAG: hypothetical protein ACE14W_03855 [Candidatus Velamenicoccus archaeovorus]
MGPQITHMPCDLEQQQRRHEARRDSVARAAARRLGKRSLRDRLLRRASEPPELGAEDVRTDEAEDVFHGFRF